MRRLIDTEPAWAEAYADLVAADAEVAADLAAYARSPAPMPADVATRVDAFLRTLDGSAGIALREERPVTRGPGHSRPGRAGPGRGPDPSRRPAGRRHHRWAWSAVGAVVAVGVGLFALVPQVFNQQDLPSSQSDRGGAAAPAPSPRRSVAQTASGRNYQPGQFGELATTSEPDQALKDSTAGRGSAAPGAAPAGTPPGARGNSAREFNQEPPAAPAELSRLFDAADLQACFDAIQAVHGGSVTLVDYARFENRAALIVVLDGARTGAGRKWVVVVGPECGRAPAVTDERYNGPLA